MKRNLMILGLVILVAMAFAAPAFAHVAPPCNDSGEPGNSDYAKHHIKPLAQAGGLGEGGHKPGVAHQGFSVCNPSGK